MSDRRIAMTAAVLAAAGLLVGFAVYAPFGLLAAGAAGFAAGAYLSRRRGAVAVAVLWGALVIDDPGSWVPVSFVTLGPWAAGMVLRARAQLTAALAQRTRELELEREAFARLAVQHERARIARELHDIVAHHLAVMVVQAGAGRMAAGDEPARQAQRFAGIRAAGGEALGEMARLVDLLEAERDTLPRLLERARAAGLEVRATVSPGDAEIDGTALRIVQEALTNALKHAPGARVDVRVHRGDGELELSVRDHGPRARATLADTGAGSGLAGLRERARAAGGRLDAGPAPGGGWRVRATLPRTSVGAAEDRH